MPRRSAAALGHATSAQPNTAAVGRPAATSLALHGPPMATIGQPSASSAAERREQRREQADLSVGSRPNPLVR